MSPSADRELRVLVVTPLGEGGAGGIDRVVDQLRTQALTRPGLHVDFTVSRGNNILASLYNLPLSALRIATGALTRRLDVVHLNVASNSSTYRKLLLDTRPAVRHPLRHPPARRAVP